MATLQVFELPAPTSMLPRPDAVEHDPVTILAAGQTAVNAARKMLEDEGWTVRSLNWKTHTALVAYVEKRS